MTIFHADHTIEIKTTASQRRREIVTYFFDKCTLISLRKVCIWSLARLTKRVPFNQEGYNQNAARLSTFASTSRSASTALNPHCSLLGQRADVDSATNLCQWCLLLQSHRGYFQLCWFWHIPIIRFTRKQVCSRMHASLCGSLTNTSD